MVIDEAAATHSASARRLFETAAAGGGSRIVVHSRVDVAVTTAYTVTA
ncbi:hypothetical protein [Streptomyces sp. NPDC058751]